MINFTNKNINIFSILGIGKILLKELENQAKNVLNHKIIRLDTSKYL